MVIKLPFSLFDFTRITAFEPVVRRCSAAAGVALPETDVYEVPKGRIALLTGVTVESTKTTSTNFSAYVKRNTNLPAIYLKDVPTGVFPKQYLIRESLGTTEVFASWPAAKNAAHWALAWTLIWLHEGDKVCVAHSLTAAETIVDDVVVNRIEYLDPREGKN